MAWAVSVSWLPCQAGPLSTWERGQCQSKAHILNSRDPKEERKLPSSGASGQSDCTKGLCLPWVTRSWIRPVPAGKGEGHDVGQAWVSSLPRGSQRMSDGPHPWRRGGFRTNWKKTSSLWKARVETWNAWKSLQSVTLFWSQYSTGLYYIYKSFQLYFQCWRKMSHIFITSTGHQS